MGTHICTLFHGIFQTYACSKPLCVYHMHNPKFIYLSPLSSVGEWAGQAGSEQRTSVVRIKIHSAPSIAGCTFTRILTTYIHFGFVEASSHSDIEAF